MGEARYQDEPPQFGTGGWRVRIAPDSWRRIRSDGQTTARVACPGCGFSATLRNSGHTIDSNGDMMPSLDCPRCQFHDHVTLIGWPGRDRVRRGAESK